MKFIKENFYDIVRLYINQIGISIFSLILYTATNIQDNEPLNLKIKLAISVFSILFYYALIYTVSWEWGAKDKIRIDGGRMTPFKSKGALLALVANSANIIFAAVCALTQYLYQIGLGDGFGTVSMIFNLFLRLFASMYVGVLQAAFDNYLAQSIGYIIIPAFAILVTHLGYTLGMKEKRIFSTSKKKAK